MIVTIAREAGSGGHEVARGLARQLRYHLVDQQLIAALARETGMPYRAAAEQDETVQSWLDRMSVPVNLGSPEMSGILAPDVAAKPAIDITQDLIRRYADQDNVVILGRGSAALLRDHRGALHAFLYAPLEWRVQRFARLNRLSNDGAEAQIHRLDRQRAEYLKTYYGCDWRDPALYDLCLNVATTGIEGAVDLLEAALASLIDGKRQAA